MPKGTIEVIQSIAHIRAPFSVQAYVSHIREYRVRMSEIILIHSLMLHQTEEGPGHYIKPARICLSNGQHLDVHVPFEEVWDAWEKWLNRNTIQIG